MTDNMIIMTEAIFRTVDTWVGEKKDPLEIAAVLMTTSMRLYKTMLSEDDYNTMVDAISDRRDLVTSIFDRQNLVQ